MDYDWALDYPDLHKACTRFKYSDLLQPKTIIYKYLPSILQDGPQCGIVALAMCTKQPSKETVARIFQIAKESNFTNNGEIFSANDMVLLCKNFLKCKIELYDGALNCDNIVNFLRDGGTLLVPYDTDKNHSPCNLNGHKAHWAVISGLIETDNCVYILAKHGKSSNVNIWDLESLSESNSQLTEFSPDRKQSNLIYKLPDGGLSGKNGIQNKSVLIFAS